MQNKEIFGAISQFPGQPQYIVNILRKTIGSYNDIVAVSPCSKLIVSFPNTLGQNVSATDSYFKFSNGWVKIYGSFINLNKVSDIKHIAEKIVLLPNTIMHDLYSYIDGHYVILTFNKISNIFSIITDRLGMLHFYYRYKDGFIFFSTSSRLLASLISFPELDSRACLEFAATGMMFEERTFYADIKKFRSGTINSFDLKAVPYGNSFSSSKLWTYGLNMGSQINSLEQAKNSITETLITTIESVINKYANLLCDLTGGFDSRMIIAGLLTKTDSFDTITAGKKSRDAEVAAEIAKTFNLCHYCVETKDMEKNFIDDIQKCLFISDGELGIVETFGPFLIQRHNSLTYSVSINGSGGELCRGRWWEGEGYNAGKKYRINIGRLIKRLFPYGCDWFPFENKCRKICLDYIEKYIKDKISLLENELNTRKIDSVYADIRLERWAGRHISNTFKLLPVMAPLVLGNLPELSFRINPVIKKRNKVIRSVIEDLNPELAAIPMSDKTPAFSVRINNLHLFLPSLLTNFQYYSQKIRHKFYVKSNNQPFSLPSKESDILIRLDNHGIINDILNFRYMKTDFLYDKICFHQFIDKCRKTSFQTHSHQLSRMLTLEWTLKECSSNIIAMTEKQTDAEIPV